MGTGPHWGFFYRFSFCPVPFGALFQDFTAIFFAFPPFPPCFLFTFFQFSLYQFHFFLSRKPFDGIFPPHRFFLRIKTFLIYQRHRPSRFRIFRSFSFVMRTKPFLQIICPSCVERSVLALHDICIIHLLHSFMHQSPEMPSGIFRDCMRSSFSQATTLF